MVVAFRAADRQTQEGLARDVGTILLILRAHAVEAERGQQLLPALGGDGELVGGDLGPDEVVVGHVVVERPDNAVSEAESVGVGLVRDDVELVVGIARQVEPVAPPAFAVARGG